MVVAQPNVCIFKLCGSYHCWGWIVFPLFNFLADAFQGLKVSKRGTTNYGRVTTTGFSDFAGHITVGVVLYFHYLTTWEMLSKGLRVQIKENKPRWMSTIEFSNFAGHIAFKFPIYLTRGELCSKSVLITQYVQLFLTDSDPSYSDQSYSEPSYSDPSYFDP